MLSTNSGAARKGPETTVSTFFFSTSRSSIINLSRDSSSTIVLPRSVAYVTSPCIKESSAATRLNKLNSLAGVPRRCQAKGVESLGGAGVQPNEIVKSILFKHWAQTLTQNLRHVITDQVLLNLGDQGLAAANLQTLLGSLCLLLQSHLHIPRGAQSDVLLFERRKPEDASGSYCKYSATSSSSIFVLASASKNKDDCERNPASKCSAYLFTTKVHQLTKHRELPPTQRQSERECSVQ